MTASLSRIILFVHDVNSQKQFYQAVFGFVVIEEIENEWVVFTAGAAELALHKIGAKYANARTHNTESNVKLVFETESDIFKLRDDLINKNVPMGDIKYFEVDYLLCDGSDPEGNVFQLRAKS